MTTYVGKHAKGECWICDSLIEGCATKAPCLDEDDESQSPRQHAVAMLIQFRSDPSNINAASLVDALIAAARQ